LHGIVDGSVGPTELLFNLMDIEHQNYVVAQSKHKISVGKELLNYIEGNKALSYKIN
jgi:hypothetical protein